MTAARAPANPAPGTSEGRTPVRRGRKGYAWSAEEQPNSLEGSGTLQGYFFAASAKSLRPPGTDAGCLGDAGAPAPGRAQARRLREVYRSAGWPCQDALEIELLAAGLLERVRSPVGHESLRVTDAGLQYVAAALAANRAAFSAHEALVERVAQEMGRSGRIVWRGLGLRAQVPADPGGALRWCVAKPDVFSIRNTTLADAVDPIVHEVKVRRADLLGDLRNASKRAAYLALGECWYVLGCDARGRAIGAPEEVPPECGVLLLEQGRLRAARAAPRARRSPLPFGTWMALAKATPACGLDEDSQSLLG